MGYAIGIAIGKLVLLFLLWIVTTVVSGTLAWKSPRYRYVAAFVLLSFPIFIFGCLAFVSYKKTKIVEPGKPYSYSPQVVQEKGRIGRAIFYGLCEKFSVNEGQIKGLTGFRLLSVKPLSQGNGEARGWNSAVDFYMGDYVDEVTHAFVSASIEESLLATLPRHIPTGVVEYKDKIGQWNRFTFNSENREIELVSANDIKASHGLVFEQIYTGHEMDLSIYQVSISVYDLSSRKLVARNVGLIRDNLWGAHNNYRLMAVPYSKVRCPRNDQSNKREFVPSWLSSISKD